MVILENLEIVLLQVGDDTLVLVADGGENVDQVYFGFNGWGLRRRLSLLRQHRYG